VDIIGTILAGTVALALIMLVVWAVVSDPAGAMAVVALVVFGVVLTIVRGKKQ